MSMRGHGDEQGYVSFVIEVKARIRQGQLRALQSVNKELLALYGEYRDSPILQPQVGEISWSKNLVIMARCKDDLQREFYLRATARFGWSKSVLQHQIDTNSYEKYLLKQTSFDRTLSPDLQA